MLAGLKHRGALRIPAAVRSMGSKKRSRNATPGGPKRRGGKPQTAAVATEQAAITDVHPNLLPGPPIEGLNLGAAPKIIGAAALTGLIVWFGRDYFLPPADGDDAAAAAAAEQKAPSTSKVWKSPVAAAAPPPQPVMAAETANVAPGGAPAPVVAAAAAAAPAAVGAAPAGAHGEATGFRRYLLFGPRDAAGYWSGEKKAK